MFIQNVFEPIYNTFSMYFSIKLYVLQLEIDIYVWICMYVCMYVCIYIYNIYTYISVPYPEVFRGGRFFDKCSKEKNRIELGGLGGAVSLPQWAPEEKPQKILAI